MLKTLVAPIAVRVLMATCSSGAPETAVSDAPAESIEVPGATNTSPEAFPQGSNAAVLRNDGRSSVILELAADIAIENTVPILRYADREWTVFAPTDEALAAMPAG